MCGRTDPDQDTGPNVDTGSVEKMLLKTLLWRRVCCRHILDGEHPLLTTEVKHRCLLTSLTTVLGNREMHELRLAGTLHSNMERSGMSARGDNRANPAGIQRGCEATFLQAHGQYLHQTLPSVLGVLLKIVRDLVGY